MTGGRLSQCRNAKRQPSITKSKELQTILTFMPMTTITYVCWLDGRQYPCDTRHQDVSYFTCARHRTMMRGMRLGLWHRHHAAVVERVRVVLVHSGCRLHRRQFHFDKIGLRAKTSEVMHGHGIRVSHKLHTPRSIAWHVCILRQARI